jgi:hypothetical protein
MNEKINMMINKAREEFGISHFPGNFFDYIINNKNYID